MAEILAPAGNFENLMVAVGCGADAVYLGAKNFNARAKAGNFDFPELKMATEYCHVRGVKVYLTLNTMVKKRELPAVIETVKEAALCHVDAFIVADLSLVSIIKSICNIPIHLSTQAGVNNLEGAIIAGELGVSRVILARETPLSEIKRIKAGLPCMEIEYFVHGALCVGFSGQCLMSSARNGDSGNRGRCRQMCRLCYESSLGRSGYLLSARDICLIDEVKALIDAGVDSFKIEGRLKSAEYVASVTSAYKKALNGELLERDKLLMDLAFNRKSGKGYLYGNNGDIIDSVIQNHVGISVGRVVSVEKNKPYNKIKFKIDANCGKIKPQKGDGVKFLSEIGEEFGGGEISEISGDFGLVYSNFPLTIGATVSLTRSRLPFYELMQEKLVPVDLKFVAKYGENICATAVCGNFRAEAVSDFCPDKAKNLPISVFDVKKQLKKTGESDFAVQNIDVSLDEGLFIPMGAINALRRSVLDNLRQNIIQSYYKEIREDFDYNKLSLPKKGKPVGNVCVIVDEKQISKELLENFQKIIFSPRCYDCALIEGMISKVDQKSSCREKCNIFLEIPVIMDENDIKVLYKTLEKYNTRLSGIYVNNISGIKIARDFNLDLILGTGFNVANDGLPFNYEFVSSVELSKAELDELGGYVFSEGRIPLMRFKHCIFKANLHSSCTSCKYNGTVTYADGKYSFPIERVKLANCSFILYNSMRSGLSGKVAPKGLFMNFYGYSKEEIIDTINAYNQKLPINNRTSLYFKDGVK